MIWNIVKKDWKLTGRWAIGVVSLELVISILPQQLHPWGGLGIAAMLWLFASIFWIVTLVQQDELPGTRQDWLIRPIRRMDMLLAKVLLAAAVLQGSGIVGDLLYGVIHGYPLMLCLRTALIHALMSFVMITVPALLLGALSQNVTQSVVMTVVLGVVVVALMRAHDILSKGYAHWFDATGSSGIHWIVNVVRFAIILGVGAVILVTQYRTRKTFRGRAALAGLVVLLVCSLAIPWKPVFAIEKALSPKPGAANGIAMQWNSHPTPQDLRSAAFSDSGGLGINRERARESVWLSLPINVTGQPMDSDLMQNNAQIVITDADGKKLYEVDGGSVDFLREGTQSGPAAYKQWAPLPIEFYKENPDRPVRVQTTFSMTLFKLGPSYSVPAVDGDRMLPGLGRCRSSIDEEHTYVEVRCVQLGKASPCNTAFMEDPRDGSRNRHLVRCAPDYAPFLQTPFPDATSTPGFFSIFRNREISEQKFPVDASKLDHAQMVIRVYEVAEHFTRVVNSPLVTMKDVTEKYPK